MTKPNTNWIAEWRIEVDRAREEEISRQLLDVFTGFLAAAGLSAKSMTTQNRYAAALSALGGFLVEQAVSDEDRDKTAGEILAEYVGPDDGPLIHHDNEAWQDELDMVCRKLYRYLRRTR